MRPHLGKTGQAAGWARSGGALDSRPIAPCIVSFVGLGALLVGTMAGCPAGPASRPEPRARAGGRGGASTLPAVQVGSGKVYRGSDGIRVALVGLVDGTYLVRITGTAHKLDGKVIRCTYVHNSERLQAWQTPFDGFDLWILRRLVDRSGSTSYLLNLPGEQSIRDLRVEYDEEASAALRPQELVGAHEATLADGTLAALLRFDVQARIRREEEAIARDAKATSRICGSALRVKVDWDALPEKTQKTIGIRSYCDELLGALRQFCADEPVREAVRKHLKEVRCRVEVGDQLAIRLDGQTLHFTTGRRGVNRHLTVREILAEKVRWPDGESIAQKIFRSQTQFCTDGKGNYVGWRPSRAPVRWTGYERQMFYGSGSRLVQVPRPERGEQFFYDPRYRTGGSGWGPRGYFSFVHFRPELRKCQVVCGARRVDLQIMSIAEVQKALGGATFGPPLATREPHGLARDREGTYYYVDKAAGDGVKDFRLYRGPLGRMVLQKMVNIVSDSEGEVYSTRSGTLRLVLEREHSFWVERGKKSTLVNVPIAKNIALVYNELGVYLGLPLGTPCDLF